MGHENEKLFKPFNLATANITQEKMSKIREIMGCWDFCSPTILVNLFSTLRR